MNLTLKTLKNNKIKAKANPIINNHKRIKNKPMLINK